MIGFGIGLVIGAAIGFTLAIGVMAAGERFGR